VPGAIEKNRPTYQNTRLSERRIRKTFREKADHMLKISTQKFSPICTLSQEIIEIRSERKIEL
jgi:hypothetical protein